MNKRAVQWLSGTKVSKVHLFYGDRHRTRGPNRTCCGQVIPAEDDPATVVFEDKSPFDSGPCRRCFKGGAS